VATEDADDLQKLLDGCDEMLDHYAASRPADDPASRVMRESRRQLAERLRVAEAAPTADTA